MVNYQAWKEKLQILYEVYLKVGKVDYKISNQFETKENIEAIERKLQVIIPPSFKETLLRFSKDVFFDAYLSDSVDLPKELSSVFSARIEWSLQRLEDCENDRRGWVQECFSNPEDSYDRVWHNKLAFMLVPNGDCIAFDLDDDKDDKRVIYLSHDDGEGHGYILGNNFTDFIDRLIDIGGCGPEDWQLLVFIDNPNDGINPESRNAKEYRKIINLEFK